MHLSSLLWFVSVSFCVVFQPFVSTVFAEEDRSLSVIPIAMGNRWEYRESQIGDDGTVNSTRQTSEQIRGFYETPRGRFFYLDADDYCMWIRNTPKGQEDVMVVVDEETTKLKFEGTPGVYYRYPVQAGRTYLVDYQIVDMPVIVMSVLELEANVEVPAGEFTCIKYQSIDKETRLTDSVHYVCPGVGLVKYESYENGKLVSISELTKFQLNEEEVPVPAKNQNSIMPIALGNTWTYQGETIEADGTTTREEPSHDIVQGMYQSDQGDLYYLDSTDFGLWIQNTPQGNADVEIELDEETSHLKLIGKPTLYYRYPAKPGTTYDLVYGEEDQAEAYSTMTLAEVDVEVTVPAGTFTCVKYESHIKETGELERIEYVAPGTGLIRTEEYLDEKMTYSSVLTRYQLNK